MDERTRVERVVGPLAHEVAPSESPEFGVDGVQELVGSFGVATPLGQQGSEVHVRHSAVGQSSSGVRGLCEDPADDPGGRTFGSEAPVLSLASET